MEYATTRFGSIDVKDEDIIVFPLGVLGFPESQRYVLIPHPHGGPCLWLQSLDIPEVAFIISEPQIFVENYTINIKLEEVSTIQAINLEQLRVYTIIRVPPKPQKPTMNLVGPLIINLEKKLGMQHVVNGSSWSHQHEIGTCSS